MLSVLHRVRAPRRLLLVLLVAATFSVNIEPRQAEAQVSGPVILVDEYADRVVFWALGFPDQSDGVATLRDASGVVVRSMEVSGSLAIMGEFEVGVPVGGSVAVSVGGVTRSVSSPGAIFEVDYVRGILTGTGPASTSVSISRFCMTDSCPAELIARFDSGGTLTADVGRGIELRDGEVLSISFDRMWTYLINVEDRDGEFSRFFDLPTDGSGFVVFTGGPLGDLVAAATAAGARSVFAIVDGRWVGYTLGAPAFVNSAFAAEFSGTIRRGTPFLLVMP